MLQLRTGATEGVLDAGGAAWDELDVARDELDVEVAGTAEVLVTLGAVVGTLVVAGTSEDGVPAAPATG
ncbi:hypothetical protein [Amycolatopsis sp. NPDC051128]|uniref:hypothetical protein n=1 Tax=Amycolatopsis sp. NPDC051128 TaxID=3155412 RepID=UPI00344479DB